MATAGDWAGQVDRVATLPAALVRATPHAVTAGAEVLEAASRVNLAAASGGDLRLSRVRSGKGAPVNVKLATRGSGSGATGLVLPVGPVSLLEGDTRRHRQPFGYAGTTGAGGRRRYATAGQQLASGGTARRKRARRGGLIFVPGLGVFTNVEHPGTKGQHPLRRAFDQHHDDAGRMGLAVFSEAISQHLG